MLCSEQVLEGLAGTAPEMIQNWILVEYHSAWPKKIKVKDLALSLEFRQKLEENAKADGWKLILIRKPRASGTKIYWAQKDSIRCTEQEGDWSWEQDEHWEELDHPLILVCTHGKRDQCCGISGGKLFAGLHSLRPEWVWQSSHLGGHRFAPTLLTLPDGMSYGRVPLEGAADLLAAVSKGEFWMPSYRRGLTSLPRWEQALQIWLDEQELSGDVFLETEQKRAFIAQGEEVLGVQVTFQKLGTCLPSCGDSMEKEIGEWIVSPL